MRESDWYVLHVVSNHEKRVAQHLRIRELEHYLPLYSERSRWSDRTVVLERPLFAGYLFVRFQPEARRAVLSMPGVLRLLGEEKQSMVSAAEVQRIQEGLASGYLLRPHQGLAVGTRVRVRRGIFAGSEGLVSEFRRQCSVVLTLTAVQQSFSLEVDISDLELLGDGALTPRRQPMLARVG